MVISILETATSLIRSLLYFFPKLQPKLQTCSSSIQEIHLGHLAGLDAARDIDVGLQCLVVGVAGPFHHDVGRDASGQSLDDECLAAGVGTD